MPKRVLMVLGPSAGGIRRHVAYLADEMRLRDWEVKIAGPAGVMDGLCALDYPMAVGAGPSAIGAGRKLRALGGDFDVIHAHGLSAGIVATTPKRSRPTVLTVHNVVLDSAGWKAPLLRQLERNLPRRVDATIAVSADITEQRGFADARVIPAPGPPPRPTRSADEVRAAYGIAADAPLCVTVARLHPQKGIPVWLDALVLLRVTRPDVVALLVGDGPDAAALRLAATERGLDDIVIWAGARPNAGDELAAADVIVIPSLWEGSPLVVAEAMSLGQPVVATKVGTVGEWLTPAAGWLVEPSDVAALAAAVDEALADPEAASRRGVAARARFVQLDVAASAFDAIATVYDEVRQ